MVEDFAGEEEEEEEQEQALNGVGGVVSFLCPG